MLLELDDKDRARDALGDYVSAHPDDVGVIRRAVEIEGLAGRWDGAVGFCERLVEASQGAEKVDAALLLTDACAKAGYPHDAARTVLEQVLAENPQEVRIREHLREHLRAARRQPRARRACT